MFITKGQSERNLIQFLSKKRGKLNDMYLDLKYGTPGAFTQRFLDFVRFNNRGTVGEQLRYGQRQGTRNNMPAIWGASEVVSQRGGKFVKTDGSGRLETADSGHTQLVGWGEMNAVVPTAAGLQTASSTEGATAGTLNPAVDAIYRIPVSATVALTRAMLYDSCDLLITSSVQEADMTTNEDVLIIVNGDWDNFNWVDVMLNPLKMGAQGIS